jgi:hypothetical protein
VPARLDSVPAALVASSNFFTVADISANPLAILVTSGDAGRPLGVRGVRVFAAWWWFYPSHGEGAPLG